MLSLSTDTSVRQAKLTHFRMDETHSNAFAVWKAMGSPQQIDGDDYRRLEQAGQLAVIEEREVEGSGGQIALQLTLPRQGVSLLRLEW